MRTQLHKIRSCVLLAAATTLAGAGGAGAQGKPYPVNIDTTFESALSVDEVEAIALQAVSRPVRTVRPDAETGEPTFHPPAPSIREIAGCRGDDTTVVHPELSRVQNAFVWVVLVRGSFSFPHIGLVDDHEGFLYIDPQSGEVIRWGLL